MQVDYGERNTVTNVTFVQSTTGLSLYTPTSGDDLSGWSVESLEIIPFKYPNDDLAVASEFFLHLWGRFLHAVLCMWLLGRMPQGCLSSAFPLDVYIYFPVKVK